jgi:indole-3-glycerol phosphate synthase
VNALERIVAETRAEVGRRKLSVPEATLERVSAARSGELRAFGEALARPGLSLIAEHKRRSPSAGLIRDDLAIEDVVSAYERGGAAALSVLTEGPSFGGSLDDLGAARAASRLPILRKDFIVDRYQLYEAVAAGADAVLLIVAALPPPALARLHAAALSLGLAVLVEVHDERELDAAAGVGALLIGINNRDLTTLRVDLRRTHELLLHVPTDATIVAESGLRSRADLDELAAAGVDAVLIGEALMRSPDVAAACRNLVEGRAAPNKSSL